MNVYIFQAEIYCEACGQAIRDMLTNKGEAPADPINEASYDSDYFPKGPFPDGGGESDCPEHCAKCEIFLGNELTSQGVDYVIAYLMDAVDEGQATDVEILWAGLLDDYHLSRNDQFVADWFNEKFRKTVAT